MKNKLIAGFVTGVSLVLLIAATTTETNIKDLPHATSLAATNLVLVLTNASKARLATVQQIVDLASLSSLSDPTETKTFTMGASSLLFNFENAGEQFGIRSQAKFTGGGASFYAEGVYSGTNGSNGQLDGLLADAYVDSGATNAIIRMNAIRAGSNANNNGTQDITENNGIYVNDQGGIGLANYAIHIVDQTSPSESYAIKTGLGKVDFGDNVTASGLILATNGLASMDTNAPVSIAATGWTNTFGKNAVVYFDGGQITFKVFNGAGTAVYTNAISVTNATVLLQPSGKVTISGNSVTGRAVPF